VTRSRRSPEQINLKGGRKVRLTSNRLPAQADIKRCLVKTREVRGCYRHKGGEGSWKNTGNVMTKDKTTRMLKLKGRPTKEESKPARIRRICSGGGEVGQGVKTASQK